MDNSNKIILDLCGGTGAWSEWYRKAGYTVIVVTLPDHDVLLAHVQASSLWIPNLTEFSCLKIPIEHIFGILFAPVCTQFSRARTTAKTKRNLKDGMLLVRAGMNIIWTVMEVQGQQADNGIPALRFWAVENPMGSLRRFLGRPKFTFDPCDYGDPWTKKTDVWGWFNEPKKKTVPISAKDLKLLKNNNRAVPYIKDLDYSQRRAITPPGFAAAFYRANK